MGIGVRVEICSCWRRVVFVLIKGDKTDEDVINRSELSGWFGDVGGGCFRYL